MSNLKIFILILVIYSFCACKKDSNQQLDCPNFGYENGYSTGNIIHHFDSSANTFHAVAAKVSNADYTTVIIDGPTLTDSSIYNEISIRFYGQNTGAYTVIPYGQTGNPVSTGQATIWLTDHGFPIVSNSGTLTVAQYDSPGGKICGSFSGDFLLDSLHISIMNGAFSATVQ